MTRFLIERDEATITYPGSLNLAIRFTLKDYDTMTRTTPLFLGYKLMTPAKPQSIAEQPSVTPLTVKPACTPTPATSLSQEDPHFSTTVGRLIDQSLPQSPKQRRCFLSELIHLCHRYTDFSTQQPKEPTQDDPTQSTSLDPTHTHPKPSL